MNSEKRRPPGHQGTPPLKVLRRTTTGLDSTAYVVPVGCIALEGHRDSFERLEALACALPRTLTFTDSRGYEVRVFSRPEGALPDRAMLLRYRLRLHRSGTLVRLALGGRA